MHSKIVTGFTKIVIKSLVILLAIATIGVADAVAFWHEACYCHFTDQAYCAWLSEIVFRHQLVNIDHGTG